jgi:hypothetical protein
MGGFSSLWWPERKGNYSTSFNVKVKNEWSCTSTPVYAFITVPQREEECVHYENGDKYNLF